MVYVIETNFYSGGGSKLNETARSYKTLALESNTICLFAKINSAILRSVSVKASIELF